MIIWYVDPWGKAYNPELGTQNEQKHKHFIGLRYMGVYMGYPYPSFCLCAFLGPTLTCQGTGSCKVVSLSSLGWLSKLWFLFGSYLGFRVQYPKRDPHFDNRPHA